MHEARKDCKSDPGLEEARICHDSKNWKILTCSKQNLTKNRGCHGESRLKSRLCMLSEPGSNVCDRAECKVLSNINDTIFKIFFSETKHFH